MTRCTSQELGSGCGFSLANSHGSTVYAAVLEHYLLSVVDSPHIQLNTFGTQIKGFSETENRDLGGVDGIASVGDERAKEFGPRKTILACHPFGVAPSCQVRASAP